MIVKNSDTAGPKRLLPIKPVSSPADFQDTENEYPP